MAKEQKSNRGLARIAIIIIVLSILSVLVGLYTEWLWFDSLNYGQIFTTIIFNKVGLYLLIFVVTFIIFYINLNLTRRHHAQKDERPAETEEGREIIYLEEERTPWRSFMQGRNSTLVFLGISLLAALILSSAAADKWIVVQQYFNRVTTGIIDPIFNKNLSFYFFNLSFYHFIYDTLMSLLLLLTVAVVVVYLIDASLEVFSGSGISSPSPRVMCFTDNRHTGA
ncbi:UPF0182 family protein [Syntrophomonas palmitatica]|uniref:UPF0182 family protein n=1 Tax=Syntrophomonas palmitatica TaxID=402877 RepID=UPI000B1F87AB|nr:UPF0182 family protein [Syntrophomonas palmitatica]